MPSSSTSSPQSAAVIFFPVHFALAHFLPLFLLLLSWPSPQQAFMLPPSSSSCSCPQPQCPSQSHCIYKREAATPAATESQEIVKLEKARARSQPMEDKNKPGEGEEDGGEELETAAQSDTTEAGGVEEQQREEEMEEQEAMMAYDDEERPGTGNGTRSSGGADGSGNMGGGTAEEEEVSSPTTMTTTTATTATRTRTTTTAIQLNGTAALGRTKMPERAIPKLGGKKGPASLAAPVPRQKDRQQPQQQQKLRTTPVVQQQQQQPSPSPLALPSTSSIPPEKEGHQTEKIGLEKDKLAKAKDAKNNDGKGEGGSGRKGLQRRNCNSELIRQLILENIHPRPSVAKRQIQSKVSARVDGRIDVICAKQSFSYIVNSELFCEAEKDGTICLCFKQQS